MQTSGRYRAGSPARRSAPSLTSHTLKIIALVTMFIDHSAAVFEYSLSPAVYWPLRFIGRIAFPLFCFMLVEGFRYTRDRRRYLAGLVIFAVLSEIPFDLALMGWDRRWDGSNVFCTLALGLLAMMVSDTLNTQTRQQRYIFPVIVLANVAPFILAGIIAVVIWTDYDARGILLIALIYYAETFAGQILRRVRDPQLARNIGAGAAVLLWMILYDLQRGWMAESYGALSAVLILLYNGQRGDYRVSKWFFYAFYPVHLLLLWFIHRVFF